MLQQTVIIDHFVIWYLWTLPLVNGGFAAVGAALASRWTEVHSQQPW